MATVIEIRPETPTAKTFRLRLSAPSGHKAGQHFVVRLTAPDGYTAARSYSLASPPDGTAEIEITVERLPGGEVSMFLHDEVQPGDQLEVRGPIGGWFIWEGGTPALLVGGGSGIVPLMAMLRLARREATADVRLVVSVRDRASLYYASELTGPDAEVLYTRRAPSGETRPPGRISAADLERYPDGATLYVCGSSPFADAVTDLGQQIGFPLDRIRVERFGPTG